MIVESIGLSLMEQMVEKSLEELGNKIFRQIQK